MSAPPRHVLSERFERGLSAAVRLHRGHVRKGSGTPYIGHLLTVAGYVLEDGGSEDEAIAALLHDAIEDQYHPDLAEELRGEFGETVVAIVEGCSQEKLPDETLTWRERKERYVRNLQTAGPEIVRVSLADKLANVRSMLRDHRGEGECLWERFKSGPEEIRWYYETLAETYTRLRPGPMAEEFSAEVERLRRVINP